MRSIYFYIQHGCPLSPHLIVVVRTAMFRDIGAKIDVNIWNWEVVYVDDTLLLRRTRAV